MLLLLRLLLRRWGRIAVRVLTWSYWWRALHVLLCGGGGDGSRSILRDLMGCGGHRLASTRWRAAKDVGEGRISLRGRCRPILVGRASTVVTTLLSLVLCHVDDNVGVGSVRAAALSRCAVVASLATTRALLTPARVCHADIRPTQALPSQALPLPLPLRGCDLSLSTDTRGLRLSKLLTQRSHTEVR